MGESKEYEGVTRNRTPSGTSSTSQPKPTVTEFVSFTYRNHRGETAVRRVRPIRIWFGSTAWHPEAGYLLEAFDLDKQATRDFAMTGVLGPWIPYFPPKEG